MLADKYRQAPERVANIESLDCTKSVRNFLCDWLFFDGLVVRYAPSGEFSAYSIHRLALGGFVVTFDSELRRYVPVKPQYKVNYRVIRELYEAGLLVARPDLKVEHEKFIMFSWRKDIQDLRREIVRRYIIGERVASHPLLKAIGGLYGVNAKYISSRGTFEIVKCSGKRIPKGQLDRTWVLADKNGTPVSKVRDMSLLDWEEILYSTAKRANTLCGTRQPEEGLLSHLSIFVQK